MVNKSHNTVLNLYRQIPICYVKRNYELGIKLSEEILLNCHSTIYNKALAWKGLFLGLLGNPDAGIKCIQNNKASNKDSESAHYWHVYGKLFMLNGDFERAINCYKNALKVEPKCAGLVRDLAFAQIQMGDIAGFKTSTSDVLKLLPKSRNSWLWFVVALHVSGDVEGALNALKSYQKFTGPKSKQMNIWEESELILYQVQLMREGGDAKSALNHLLGNRQVICDGVSADETLVELFIQRQQFQDAIPVIYSLLKRNPNNENYYRFLFAALDVKGDLAQSKIVEKLIDEHPLEMMPKMLLLQRVSGKKFLRIVADHIKKQIRKGSASLFESMKCLLKNDAKKSYIKSLLLKHQAVLNDVLSHQANKKEAEVGLVANYICMAKVLDSEKDLDAALDCIHKALAVNPLDANIYATKAKILKHALNLTEACRAMEKAQRMDPLDRWLKVKLVKYLLKADLIEQGDQLFSELLVNESEIEIVIHLWYFYEKALAYERVEKWNEALTMCHLVDEAINRAENNLFELHSASFKNMSLRAYVSFLNASKNLRNNKIYFKTATLGVILSKRMHDRQLRLNKKANPKVLKKKRLTQETTSLLTENKSEGSEKQMDKVVSKDSTNYLKSASHFLKVLQMYRPDDIGTQKLSYEIYSSLGRPLLMMQSLLKARKIDRNHPSLLVPIIHMHESLLKWSEDKHLPQNKIAVLLEIGKRKLWKNKSMEELTAGFLRNHDNDLRYLVEGGKALYRINPFKQEDALRFEDFPF